MRLCYETGWLGLSRKTIESWIFVLRSSLRIATDVEVIEVDRRYRSFFCCQVLHHLVKHQTRLLTCMYVSAARFRRCRGLIFLGPPPRLRLDHPTRLRR